MNFDLNKESFDIEPEIIVSNILNEYSNWIFTEKNFDDPYGYDLRVIDKNYGIDLGFIEVEKSNYNKLSGKNWEHSFLKRKICEYDKINKCFLNNLKENAEQTIYIKFNRNFSLDDCICCDMKTISQFTSDYQMKTNNNYYNGVFRTTMDDKRVKIGINDCIGFIEKFFGGI